MACLENYVHRGNSPRQVPLHAGARADGHTHGQESGSAWRDEAKEAGNAGRPERVSKHMPCLVGGPAKSRKCASERPASWWATRPRCEEEDPPEPVPV
eukprot:CAMPEP_0175477606 /NCGR_PEP_ID=MMETSP0095-20121207/76516_1 /TAXON_ID=311494 /ORGANISM="Alexandrium monilatum, Strain CCMP3105" /LENGTH=97 /DNA_ID=CAMNT_0016779203 /DNA_START=11 /DNA_END=304 /DNA_ORIENTATION=+